MIRLPPSAALRAFAAVARRGSFTAAAEELFVTQSAVSHQIKHLEDLWEMPLFTRGRLLKLTPEGERLAPIVRDFLLNLEGTLDELRGPDRLERLKLSMTQSLAYRWLLPRLADFKSKNGSIDIWISYTDELVQFDVDDIDAGIRLGGGAYKNVYSELILREYVFPVASPTLIERLGMPGSDADLKRYPLLLRSGKDIVPRWEDWFAKVGVGEVNIPEGSRYPDTSMTIQAAVDGQAVALVRSAHITDEMETGKLVRLTKKVVVSPIAYYFVCLDGTQHWPKISRFRTWLMEQARSAQALYDRRDS
jgi:LysR family glycine cleavage system transcriptional activator